MEILENYPLSKLTTFHIGGPATHFVKVGTLKELLEAVDFAHENKLGILVLGGGSNMLVSDSGFAGLVIKIGLRGIEIVSEDKNSVVIKVRAGENWDDVVEFAVSKGFWGIENLSWVPGKAGAVCVQNVGCYGQEAADVVEAVEVLDLKDGKISKMKAVELNFGYRSSRFNAESKNQFIILDIYFKLSKIPKPIVNYVDLRQFFDELHNTHPSIREIREALGVIRGWKFPKIEEMGNDGSCFKNVLLNQEEVQLLDTSIRKNFSNEIFEKYLLIKNKFPMEGKVKIPAAFLVDICGLKGTEIGGAILWDRQPLVIANKTNKAKASDIALLFKRVRQEVFKKTGIALQSEPEWIGFSKEELTEYFSL